MNVGGDRKMSSFRLYEDIENIQKSFSFYRNVSSFRLRGYEMKNIQKSFTFYQTTHTQLGTVF